MSQETNVFTTLDERVKEIKEVLDAETPKLMEQLAITLAQSVAVSDAVIDTCNFGHRFSKLPDHPLRMGRPICVHCATIGLKKSWITIGELTNDPDLLRVAAELPELEANVNG